MRICLRPQRGFPLVCYVLFLCCSCSDPDFGDKALSFVQDELPHLSRQLAKADLDNRWSTTYTIFLVDARARERLLRDALAELTTAIGAIEAATSVPNVRVSKVRELEEEVLGAQRLNEQLVVMLDSAKTMCSSRALFDQSGLADLGLVSVVRSFHPVTPDISVNISVGSGSDEKNTMDLGKTIEQLFVASKVEAQNRKLQEALELAPQVVPNAEELFPISSELCRASRDRAQAAIDDLQASEDVLKETLLSLQQYTIAARHVLEARAVGEALGWDAPDPLTAALRGSQITGATEDLRGRLTTELRLAANGIVPRSTGLTARDVYLQARANEDRAVLLRAVKAIRDAKLDVSFGSSFAHELQLVEGRLTGAAGL
jgi:hypothetical protein